jgi:hypothetical protein
VNVSLLQSFSSLFGTHPLSNCAPRSPPPPHPPSHLPPTHPHVRPRRFDKTIRYACRKAYAEVRPRIKGRFATKQEVQAWEKVRLGL